MANKDLYEILGVAKEASQDEIKKAYRKLAHQHHPDKSGGDEAKFKEINSAYQVLSNEQKRQQYDQFGQNFNQAGGGQGGQGGFGGGMNWDDFARASGGQQGPFGQGGQGAEYDMGDIFGDIFGFGKRGGASSGASAQGGDIQAEMQIEFKEAAFGAEKVIDLYKHATCSHCKGNGAEPGSKIDTCKNCNGQGKVERVQQTVLGAFRTATVCPECRGEGKKYDKKCKECSGDGRVKESEKIKVKIPAGIAEGETIRLSGKGEVGLKGAPAGDLYVTMRVVNDPNFNREGDDILSEVNISISQATLGDKINIMTLDGEVTLKVPSGTQSGKVFSLKGKGTHHLRIRGRGDHLVTVNIQIPTKLSRDQKKLFEQLSKLD
ncbi:MAG: molecular chaperone DnaJ [Candidatus Kerfeldbacteria bacterium]